MPLLRQRRPVVTVGRFAPFSSRRGETVLKVVTPYDSTINATIRRVLAEQKQYVINPERNILQPGGWLPQHKCWFVEPAVWLALRPELERLGVSIDSRSS